ncbi:MAG: ABC transporter substrate-binding protein [bacterium]
MFILSVNIKRANKAQGGDLPCASSIKFYLPLLYFVFLFLLIHAGCQRPTETGDEQGQKKKSTARTARVLRVYSALDPNETKIYFSEYEKETGVSIQWVRMSSGAVMARVMAEKANPTMGLWFGGPSTDFIHAAQEGLLEPYRPRMDFEPLKNAHDAQWRWTGFYFGAIAFASNKEILKQKKLPPPTSWRELLRPEFYREVGIAYPYTSGTAYTVIAALVQLMGEDEAFWYIAALDRNVHHYTKSGSACVTQVGLGEIGVCVAFSHDVVKKGISKGYPVVMSFPQDGTGYEIGAMALIRGGPDHEEAKLFMDWVLSVKAQNLMKKWYRIPLNPHAEIVEGAVRASDINLIQFDEMKAGADKTRLVEKWRLITAQ